MLAQGQRGAIAVSASLSPGSTPNMRLGNMGDLIKSDLHGRYYEGTYNKSTFSAVLAATTGTIAAGNIVAAAPAAATQFAIWNPVGSGVNMVPLKLIIGVISGTPPGGPVFHGRYQGVPTVANTGTAPLNNFQGGPNSAMGYMLSAGGAALTGGAAPSIIRPTVVGFSAGAFVAVAGQAQVIEEMAGDIIIPPGFGYVPLWATAGTTLLNAYGLTWEEVPV